MRNEFIPASRSLMPMHSPEKPPPIMRTSTVFSDAFEYGAEDSLMRGSSLLCWSPRSPREREETRRLPAKTRGLPESSAARAARHEEPPARFSVRRELPQRGRVLRNVLNHPAELRPRQRE